MKWNMWPYWVGGGVVGILSYVVVFIASYSSHESICKPAEGTPPCLTGLQLLLSRPLDLMRDMLSLNFLKFFLVAILFGVVFGWISMKIKGRKQIAENVVQ